MSKRGERKGWFWERPFSKPAITPEIKKQIEEEENIILTNTTDGEMNRMLQKLGKQSGTRPPRRIRNSKNNKKSRVRRKFVRDPHVENMQGRGKSSD